MEYHIDIKDETDEISELFRQVKSGDTLYCKRDSQFEICKKLLVRFKLADVTICLLDQDDYIVHQTSSRKREKVSGPQLNDRQMAVIAALERVLQHCKKEGIALIGYSDELVAMPECLAGTDISSAYALDVDSSGVYRGADGIDSFSVL